MWVVIGPVDPYPEAEVGLGLIGIRWCGGKMDSQFTFSSVIDAGSGEVRVSAELPSTTG